MVSEEFTALCLLTLQVVPTVMQASSQFPCGALRTHPEWLGSAVVVGTVVGAVGVVGDELGQAPSASEQQQKR